MFSFEQFPVYIKALQFYTFVNQQILTQSTVDYVIKEQP